MNYKKLFFLIIFSLLFLLNISTKEEFLKIYTEFNSNKKQYNFYADNSHFIPYNVKIEFKISEILLIFLRSDIFIFFSKGNLYFLSNKID